MWEAVREKRKTQEMLVSLDCKIAKLRRHKREGVGSVDLDSTRREVV
jgi:hypothetical protein